MASVNRVYAARLAGMVVLGPDGESLGRVRDVVISISIVRQQPRVLGLVVELLTRRRIFVPILRVTAIEPSAVTLTTANVSLRRFVQRPGEVLVLGQVLDSRVRLFFEVKNPEEMGMITRQATREFEERHPEYKDAGDDDLDVLTIRSRYVLAAQIAYFCTHMVVIDDGDMTHAGTAQVQRYGRTQTACADHQHPRGQQAGLTIHTELVEQNVARIAQQLVVSHGRRSVFFLFFLAHDQRFAGLHRGHFHFDDHV